MGDSNDGYRIRVCLGELNEAQIDEVAAFLIAERALDDDANARERAAQSAVLVYAPDGSLAGHTSVEARYVEQLDNRFWLPSSYITPGHRQANLASRMVMALRDDANRRFCAGQNPEVIGLFMVVQTRAYDTRRNMAITPAGYMFVGRNRRGDNMRVYYFDGAKLDGSAPDYSRPKKREPLRDDYRLEPVLGRMSEEQVEEVAVFLQREGALKDPDLARQRARMSVVLARDTQGRLVGQHAAEARYLRQLLNEFWAVSVYVGKAHRQSHLASHINLLGRDTLAQNFAAGNNPTVIGAYMRMLSPNLRSPNEEAVLNFSRFAFIGRNRKGENLRVYYFPDARIDAGSADIEGPE